VRFVETHPDEVERIVASTLETAAALEATGVPVASRSIPSVMQRLVTSTRADSDDGRVLNISEAAEMLNVTRVTIYAWIEAKRLLAWRATRRGVLVPAEQIMGPGKVVPGIDRVLAIISDPEAAWDFVTQQSPYVSRDALQRPRCAEGRGARACHCCGSFLPRRIYVIDRHSLSGKEGVGIVCDKPARGGFVVKAY
jgi:excisionase family DNA binding protein